MQIEKVKKRGANRKGSKKEVQIENVQIEKVQKRGAKRGANRNGA